MSDPLDQVRDEIAMFVAMLNDDAKLSAFAEDHPDVATDAEDARDYIRSILVGLDDVLHDRTVPHEEIVRQSEERRRQARLDAAE